MQTILVKLGNDCQVFSENGIVITFGQTKQLPKTPRVIAYLNSGNLVEVIETTAEPEKEVTPKTKK
jgi:hypothetical protein